jgi:hypothetical protein
LFITIEIAKKVALRPRESAVDSIIHPSVPLYEGPDPRVTEQPLQGAISRTTVMHDVFDSDALVGNGLHTQFQPRRVLKTWRDD